MAGIERLSATELRAADAAALYTSPAIHAAVTLRNYAPNLRNLSARVVSALHSLGTGDGATTCSTTTTTAEERPPAGGTGKLFAAEAVAKVSAAAAAAVTPYLTYGQLVSKMVLEEQDKARAEGTHAHIEWTKFVRSLKRRLRDILNILRGVDVVCLEGRPSKDQKIRYNFARDNNDDNSSNTSEDQSQHTGSVGRKRKRGTVVADNGHHHDDTDPLQQQDTRGDLKSLGTMHVHNTSPPPNGAKRPRFSQELHTPPGATALQYAAAPSPNANNLIAAAAQWRRRVSSKRSELTCLRAQLLGTSSLTHFRNTTKRHTREQQEQERLRLQQTTSVGVDVIGPGPFVIVATPAGSDVLMEATPDGRRVALAFSDEFAIFDGRAVRSIVAQQRTQSERQHR